jgi:hypothetical protein
LIATLKAELAAQKESTKEIQRLNKQLQASESTADNLQSKIAELTASLNEARSEIRSLNLKLTAARNAEAAATAAAKVPGSAIKGASGAASRLAAANASEATLAAQKKEDLYGDLTGLIVRSVKREGGEDMFDCIQTGRNGSEWAPLLLLTFILCRHMFAFLNDVADLGYPLTSTALQTRHRHRHGRGALPLHSAAGCEPGPRADRRAARLSCRRDLVPAGAGREILCSGSQGAE